MTQYDPAKASWYKSSHSGSNGGNCIEAALGFPGIVPVRDSKDPGGPVLAFSREAFADFVAAVRVGEFPAG